MVITAWLFLLAAYPSFWLMDAYPSLATAMFAVGFLNLIKAGYSGVLPSVLCEQFPVETRAVGVAFAFQHLGHDFRRLRPVCRDVAYRADRRSAVAGLLSDGDGGAQHRCPDGDTAARGACRKVITVLLHCP